MPRRVGIVGMGYVGLATAVALAKVGHKVVGYDLDQARAEALRKGVAPLYEEGLPELFARQSKLGRLSMADSAADLLARCEVIFLCLPTPSGSDGSIDLSFLRASAEELGTLLARIPDWRLFVVKSTVVPGTADSVVAPILARRSRKAAGRGFSVASNPEFLAEGTMVADAIHPARIVLGTQDRKSEAVLRALYAPFHAPIVVLPPAGAELVKYASNTMLAARVSFANEIASMAERAGVDYRPVMDAVGLDPRIGPRFLVAGPGFGGSCFPKDVRALAAWAKGEGLSARLAEAALAANEDQPRHVVDVAAELVPSLDGSVVALLGLSFKAGTSDCRESRAYPILAELLRRGASVRLYDPHAAEEFRKGMPDRLRRSVGTRVRFTLSLAEATRGSDIAVIHTDWKEFRTAPTKIWKGLRQRAVVDARRSVDPARLSRAGVRYRAVGLGTR